jgi:hypothetical protein
MVAIGVCFGMQVTEEGPRRLDFCRDGMLAGYFMDLATYPTAPGLYRYMPYRSPGHLLLGQQCNDARFALCTRETSDQHVPCVVRSSGEYGFLLIDRIGEQS